MVICRPRGAWSKTVGKPGTYGNAQSSRVVFAEEAILHAAGSGGISHWQRDDEAFVRGAESSFTNTLPVGTHTPSVGDKRTSRDSHPTSGPLIQGSIESFGEQVIARGQFHLTVIEVARVFIQNAMGESHGGVIDP